MVMTPSTMMALGTIAPSFSLKDPATGKLVTLSDTGPTVVIFMCNHCPFVVHIITKLAEVGQDYQNKGIQFIGINANDIEAYPTDSPENMVEFSKQHTITFPYLFDSNQSVAKAYDAACTPDFFVFNKHQQCVYRGQFDDSRPGNESPVTGSDLKYALDCLLNETNNTQEQKPSIGCNIKWK